MLWMQVLRVVMTFGSLLALVFNLYQVIDEYLYDNVSVNLRLDTISKVIFPAVTVCNLNPIVCHRAEEYEALRILLPHNKCPPIPPEMQPNPVAGTLDQNNQPVDSDVTPLPPQEPGASPNAPIMNGNGPLEPYEQGSLSTAQGQSETGPIKATTADVPFVLEPNHQPDQPAPPGPEIPGGPAIQLKKRNAPPPEPGPAPAPPPEEDPNNFYGSLLNMTPGSYWDPYNRRISFLSTMVSLNQTTRSYVGYSFDELIHRCTFGMDDCFER